MKRPSFQFYPGDWMRDSALRSCSVGARGLWMDMLCLMHEGTPYGYLKVNLKVILPPNLARIVGSTLPETEGWLSELEDAGVFSRDQDGAIFSRRMIRDESIRQSRACGGKLGGNPALKDNHKVGEKVGNKVNLPANLQPTPSSSSSSSSSNEDTVGKPTIITDALPLPAKPKAERARNPLIDCLATIQGEKLEEVTNLAFASAAKALNEIRKVCPDVTPEELTRRAKNISLSWGGKAVSPMSLAKHWATGAKAVQPQLGWQQPADKPKPMWLQMKELEARIDTHPGNWNWLKYNAKTATKEQKDEYRALLKQLEAMQAGQEPLPMGEGDIP